MRSVLALLLISTAMSATAADTLTQQMDYLILSSNLEHRQAQALAQCVKDVPGAKAMLNLPLVSKFCVVRFGAERKQALFLGEHLSKWYEDRGEKDASRVIDRLLDALNRS